MAISAGTIWGHIARPWGYEVRVDFTDDATGAIYNECMTFPSAPSQEVLDARVESLRVRVQEMAYPPPPPIEYEVTNADGTVTQI